MVFCYRPLSAAALRRLQRHQYNCENSSLADPLLQYWWRHLVTWCPLWLAPNVITLVGLAANVTATLALVAQSPGATDILPRWSCVVFAMGLFVFQSLDAIDGKQARRTNSSSPLGELFDHGCDSISVLCVVVGVTVLLGLGEYPVYLFVMCYVALFMFYQAHWQTYITGVMRFGFIDVTEEQLLVMLLFIVSAVFGADIWNYQLGGSGVQVKVVVFWLGLMPTAVHAVGSVLHCCRHRPPSPPPPSSPPSSSPHSSSSSSHTDLFHHQRAQHQQHQQLSSSNRVWVSLSPGLAVLLAILPAAVAATCGSVSLIYSHYPVLYIGTLGLAMAKLTCRLVVAHMSRSPMLVLDSSMAAGWLLLLSELTGLTGLGTRRLQLIILLLLLVFVVCDFIIYWYAICDQICRHLGIYCFRLGSRPHVATVANTADSLSGGCCSHPGHTTANNNSISGSSGSSSGGGDYRHKLD